MATPGQFIDFILKDSRLRLKYLSSISGAQAKAQYSGCYQSDQNIYYIKSSLHYPADDVAEIITASIFNDITKDQNTYKFAHCEFLTSPDKKRYLLSYGLNNWINLLEIANRELAKSETSILSKTLNLFTLKSIFTSNKHLLIQFLQPNSKDTEYDTEQKKRLRYELSIILILSYLIGDYDVQPENLGIYIGTDGLQHIGKIDHGWAFASLCAINSEEHPGFTDPIILPFGKLGTHNLSLRPTNHFNNYTQLYETQEFTSAIKMVTNSSFINRFYDLILSTLSKLDFADKKLFYEHLGISQSKTSDKTDSLQLGKVIAENIQLSIKARAINILELFRTKPLIVTPKYSHSPLECTDKVTSTIVHHGFELLTMDSTKEPSVGHKKAL